MNQNTTTFFPEDLFNEMFKDRKIRTAITRENHSYFFHFYFSHYVTYPTAPFQREILSLTENNDDLFIVSFRSSGKSTMITTSYPIWALLGKQQKKFILMLFQTQTQARQHLKNLRHELENNELLKNDLGPFYEESDEWGSNSLVFTEHNARISVASTEQSVRGLRHQQYRPDLLICDDLENLASVKTREGRDKVHQWLTSEVIPAGDPNTRLVIVGNLLHEDSILMRIKKSLAIGQVKGIFKEYPLITDDGKVLWPGKYPTSEDILRQKMKMGSESAWQREFLLKIVYPDNQIIKREWIQYYDSLPNRDDAKTEYRMAALAVDLGVKETEMADPTAIVMGHMYGSGDNTKIYISPDFFNRKVSLLEIIAEATKRSENLNKNSGRARIIIEDVAAQHYAIQGVQNKGYFVEGFKPRGDKAERLTMIGPFIQNKQILFHKSCEEIINQIVNFGVERHDDLCDALVMLVTVLMKSGGHSTRGIPDVRKYRNDLESDWDDPEVGGLPNNEYGYSGLPKNFRKKIF